MSVSMRCDSLTRELEHLLIQLLTMEPKGFRPNDYNSGAYNPHDDDDSMNKAFTIFKTREYKGCKFVDVPLFFGRFFSVNCKIPLLRSPIYPQRGYQFTGRLDMKGREYQQNIVNEALEHLKTYKTTLIAAHPGAGKTVMGAAVGSLVAKHPVAIIIHLELLISQWRNTFSDHTDAKVYTIGERDNKCTIEEANVYLVMDQRTKHIPENILYQIGTVIVDEAHRFCTAARALSLLKFRPQYLILLSATPKRQDGLHSVLHAFAGEHSIIKKYDNPFHVYCVHTSLTPVREQGYKGNVNFTKLSQSLMYSDVRNLYICHLVLKNPSKKILILIKEKKHVDILSGMLTELGIRNACMRGSDKSYVDSPVLIGTVAKIGTAFDESSFAQGFNGKRLELLIMAVFYRDPAVIEQNVGRVLRASAPNIIYLLDNDSICDRHWAVFRRWAQNNQGTQSGFMLNLPNMAQEMKDFGKEHIEKVKKSGGKRIIVKRDEIVLK